MEQMMAQWFYVGAAILFLIGTILSMQATPEDETEDEPPWGFNVVKDGGVCDGGSYDGWEEEE